MIHSHVYGLNVASDVPIPELAALSPPEWQTRAQTCVRFAPPRNQERSASWFMEWPLPSGELWLSCGKTSDGYLLRFPMLADFSLTADGHDIVCFPRSGTPQETLHHLLLDQVLPLVLNLQGRDALHATAVVTPHGGCAFTGETGTGKSTLAASFAQAGYPVLSDDCLVIEEHDGRLVAVPAYPGVRLWDDTCVALVSEANVLSPVAHYTDKQRVVWQEQVATFPTRSVPLHRIYLLTRATAEPSAMICLTPRIDLCSHRQAFMALLEQTFRLDVTDSVMLVRQMHWLERLISQVPVRCLQIPNDFSALPAVRAVVLADCAPLGGARP